MSYDTAILFSAADIHIHIYLIAAAATSGGGQVIGVVQASDLPGLPLLPAQQPNGLLQGTQVMLEGVLRADLAEYSASDTAGALDDVTEVTASDTGVAVPAGYQRYIRQSADFGLNFAESQQ